MWLEARGGTGPAEAREAVARTRAFLLAHGASRFEAVGEARAGGLSDHRPVIDRAGWRDEATYYLAADAWRALHRGADPTRAARHVAEAGFLAPGDGRNWTQRLAASLVRERPRAYAVRSGILGADDA